MKSLFGMRQPGTARRQILSVGFPEAFLGSHYIYWRLAKMYTCLLERVSRSCWADTKVHRIKSAKTWDWVNSYFFVLFLRGSWCWKQWDSNVFSSQVTAKKRKGFLASREREWNTPCSQTVTSVTDLRTRFRFFCLFLVFLLISKKTKEKGDAIGLVKESQNISSVVQMGHWMWQ